MTARMHRPLFSFGSTCLAAVIEIQGRGTPTSSDMNAPEAPGPPMAPVARSTTPGAHAQGTRIHAQTIVTTELSGAGLCRS